jgi:hypothetical protein
MILYFSCGFFLWLTIYLMQRRCEGMSGVLDSLSMFLLWNLFLWPVGLAFLSFMFTVVALPLIFDLMKEGFKNARSRSPAA